MNNARVKKLFLIGCALSSFLFALSSAEAAYPELTLRHKHHIFTLDPDSYPAWRGTEEVWMYEGKEIEPAAELRIDGDSLPALPRGIIRSERPTWNVHAMEVTLKKAIEPKLNRSPRDVTIKRSATGAIVFEGVGMLGRSLQTKEASALIAEAMTKGMTEIILPVEEIAPTVTVLDPELRKSGIKEIVTVGESSYAGSPIPRRHNIAVGLSKFNGHLIPKGETFSFNKVLGKVDASTGYWKELVIMGDLTIPEYGGGLCQVSTTAYRGVWEYGFPIAARRNHSFAVRYYFPEGTDATIYPPHTDMTFINDSPGAILIQTHQENDQAYFIYYGTKDTRQTEIIGPYTWDFRAPPADRTEYTTEIPAGTTRKAGDKHPGLKAQWFRILTSVTGEEKIESVFSAYEARPFITQIGISTNDGDVIARPTWLGEEWDEES
ncbi:hypothetical protein A3D88_04115 [Candidatus Peribacteria bacterium RIFCSPHIGHO2_02_FULL_52_16]|nr:MAG: hypothetical protein A3D88_04115 [Candidatus Peribacteria bacterium RIFCSPHIGHO2_02_FULL_52_16]